MKRQLLALAALAAIFWAPPSFAKAACPADNHQQIYDMDAAQHGAQKPDLTKWADFIKERAALCPDDYEALGYLATQMRTIAANEADPVKSLKYVDLAFDLGIRQRAVYKPNLPQLAFKDKDGKEQKIFTLPLVDQGIRNILLPLLVKHAKNGTTHSSLTKNAKMACAYHAADYTNAEEEAKYWVQLVEKTSWLKKEWAQNRLGSLAQSCGDRAAFFLLAKARIEDLFFLKLDAEYNEARRKGGSYPTTRDKQEIAEVDARRRAQAAITADAYDAFLASGFRTKSETEHLRKGFRYWHNPTEHYPGFRAQDLRKIAAASAK